MGSPTRLAPAALAVTFALALAGCTGSPAADPEAPDSTPGLHEISVDVEDGPLEGTCWTVANSNDDPIDPDFWFDDSPRVPCSEPHTTQTVRVLRLQEPTLAAAREEADVCWQSALGFIGIDPGTWVPWMSVLFLPSKDQIADGASWARCDAAFPSRWDHSRARTTTGSAVLIADDPPLELWACLDQHPAKVDQPLVPCDQPHAYEQTGRLAVLEDLNAYPAAARLKAEARTQCVDGVPNEYKGNINVVARWDPPGGFEKGADIVGACFMALRDGAPFPARNSRRWSPMAAS